MRTTLSSMVITSLLLAAGCSDPVMEQRVADLESKVKTLEEKVATLESQPAAPAARATPKPAKPAAEAAPAASPEDEEAASALLQTGSDHLEKMEYDEARKVLSDLVTRYPTTRAARSASRVVEELEVIGIDAGQLEIEKWYAGQTSMDSGKATLIVFWEAWCPHCRREVPALEATWEKYEGKGLNLVALTKVTKSSSDEKVKEFISENSLTFPVAKETGTMSSRFQVRGIPAAAVVKDGKVVWRGHPARITEEMYKAWLDLPA